MDKVRAVNHEEDKLNLSLGISNFRRDFLIDTFKKRQEEDDMGKISRSLEIATEECENANEMAYMVYTMSEFQESAHDFGQFMMENTETGERVKDPRKIKFMLEKVLKALKKQEEDNSGNDIDF